MSMSKFDKFTIVAIGAAGIGLVHVAFEESGGLFGTLFGSLSQLPHYVPGFLLALISWELFPYVVIAFGIFGIVLLILRR